MPYREGQTARASSILGPKTASFYSSGSARVSLLVEYSARNTRLFGRPLSTRLGILDFSAELPSAITRKPFVQIT